MTGTERVRNVILGKPVDRQPIYGWVSANLSEQISEKWGSVAAFEDAYEFDAAHIFGVPDTFVRPLIEKIQAENEEFTPDLIVDEPVFTDPDREEDYDYMRREIAFHKERGRFCYVQAPGFFEHFNGIFGIAPQRLDNDVLLNPLEEDLNLPTVAVDVRHLQRGDF